MWGSKARVQFKRADGTTAKFQAKEGRRRKTNRPLNAYQRFVKDNIRKYLPTGRKLTPEDMGRAMKLVSQLWNRRAGNSTSAGQKGYGGARDTGDVFYKTTSKSKSKSKTKRKSTKKKAAAGTKRKAATGTKRKAATKRTTSKTSKAAASKRKKTAGAKRKTTKSTGAKRSTKTGRFQSKRK